MAKALRILGFVWMSVCAVLWLWIGLYMPEPNMGSGWMNWTVPRLLADSRLGLSFVPIVLAIPGYQLWRRGGRKD